MTTDPLLDLARGAACTRADSCACRSADLLVLEAWDAAVRQARAEARRAVRLRGVDGAALWLRRQSAERALRPLAAEQLLAMEVLREAARLAKRAGWPEAEPSRSCRPAVRLIAARSGVSPLRRRDLEAAVDAELRRYGDLPPTQLAAGLRRTARLNTLLWDEPGLPASPAVRLAMLAGVPHLEKRARTLVRVHRRARFALRRPAAGRRVATAVIDEPEARVSPPLFLETP